jgi:drug/metabolite transporter superfamily protein YnfA
VTAAGRIVGGFLLLMVGFGVILDTSWDVVGAVLCLAGGGVTLWGARMRG